MKDIWVVAEMCCNHNGCPETAFKMAREAIAAGAAFVKFQKWHPKEAFTAEDFLKPHPVPYNSFGETYGEHRENLELDLEVHRDLKQEIESLGSNYAVSVFDITSANQMIKLQPSYIKIPSQRNLNKKLLEKLAAEFDGDIHCSTGMTTDEELDEIVSFFSKANRNKDLVLYHCTSSYPCEFKDLRLLGVQQFCQKYGNEVKAIGFSGHHNGIAADPVAYVLGAEYIERHFTLDRTMKGTDHPASLEPQGLQKLIRDLNNVKAALIERDGSIIDAEKHARNYSKYQPSWEDGK